MRPSKPPRPHNRDGIWYLIRKVPKRFRHLEKRTLVYVSTKIVVAHDPRGVRATEAVRELNAGLEAYWQMLQDGQADDAKVRFEAAQKRARTLQLPYQTNAELAEGSIDEILKRIELLVERKALDDSQEVAAVMGGEERPTVTLTTLLSEYESIHKAALAKKSENQMHKWRNQRKRAIGYLIALIGDKPLLELTRADTIRYRDWWQDHVLQHDLKLASANKSIGFLAKMVKDVDRRYQLSLDPVFADLRFSGARDGKRPAFDADFVQNKILAPGALDTLNPQARAILHVVAELGLRPSEVAELRKNKVFLEAKIPFIRVMADERELKTYDSERDMPLVGYALAAMKEFPDGFPEYRDNEDTLSNTVNKYLKQHNLRPTKEHTFYSLRHTFEDRLTAVEPPEKIMAVLMGHAYNRPKYGEGPTLAQKQKWLKMIAFKTPEELAAQKRRSAGQS